MAITPELKQKLATLPARPGVYLMRDRAGKVIYVGKARHLRNRVRHYFQQATLRKADPKLRSLIDSVHDLQILVAGTDEEATLSEARLIKEYRPRYNVMMRDDKRYLQLRIQPGDPFPRITTCRLRKQDGAVYVGPFANAGTARAVRKFAEEHYGLRACRSRVPGDEDYRHCINDIIRYCSAPCVGKVTPGEYAERVGQAIAFLRGERREVLNEIRQARDAAAERLDYERAAELRDVLRAMDDIIRKRSRMAKTKDILAEEGRRGVEQLARALGLSRPPRVIECYDISNISGTHAVASGVCAVDGRPDRRRYRHYRIRTVEGSDDPAMMAEVLARRFRPGAPAGDLPDLVVVDGGLTQLRATRQALAELGHADFPVVGLAKRFEEVYTPDSTLETPLRLPRDSAALRVLQQLRDEAHRFALTHHRGLRRRRLLESALDDVEGVGAVRRRRLLETFGSIQRLKRATAEELTRTPGIGPELARQIHAALHRGDAPGEGL